jgi:hypothetical protein
MPWPAGKPTRRLLEEAENNLGQKPKLKTNFKPIRFYQVRSAAHEKGKKPDPPTWPTGLGPVQAAL